MINVHEEFSSLRVKRRVRERERGLRGMEALLLLGGLAPANKRRYEDGGVSSRVHV